MEEEHKKYKVMVVDDEPVNIFLLEGILQEEGYDVCTATDGAEALAKVSEFFPDTILLDIMMPGISGIEVLEKLVENPETCHIPVIMVTAKGEAEDVQLALSKGAIEYIKKPINEVEMLARLRTVIRLKLQEDNLRDLLQSKEDLIHMVSHDMRAPLISVSGLAEMLLTDQELNQKMNSEHKELLQIIINSTNFSIDYFNKLLNWSNLGAKQLFLSKEWLSLNQVINASGIIFHLRMEEKRLKFIVDCGADMKVFADVSYFQQIVNNLLSNAIKYTPEGGSITIRGKKEGDVTIFEIIDTGIGISGITPEELFGSAFHKSTRGTKGEKGTGVGLRICKIICDAHGFDLSYTSEQGRGTTFMISIQE
jgi:two-component system, sensor histidine kinase and response regulator